MLNLQGLPAETDEYDFGASIPARKTITTYAALGTPMTVTAGTIVDQQIITSSVTVAPISNRVSSQVVEDGSGNILAKTTYGYDEFAVANLVFFASLWLRRTEAKKV